MGGGAGMAGPSCGSGVAGAAGQTQKLGACCQAKAKEAAAKAQEQGATTGAVTTCCGNYFASFPKTAVAIQKFASKEEAEQFAKTGVATKQAGMATEKACDSSN